jgi:hypothetical protein
MAASSTLANAQLDKLETGITDMLVTRETAATQKAQEAEAELNSLLDEIRAQPDGEEGIPLVKIDEQAETPLDTAAASAPADSLTRTDNIEANKQGKVASPQQKRTCEPALGWLWDLVGV